MQARVWAAFEHLQTSAGALITVRHVARLQAAVWLQCRVRGWAVRAKMRAKARAAQKAAPLASASLPTGDEASDNDSVGRAFEGKARAAKRKVEHGRSAEAPRKVRVLRWLWVGHFCGGAETAEWAEARGLDYVLCVAPRSAMRESRRSAPPDAVVLCLEEDADQGSPNGAAPRATEPVRWRAEAFRTVVEGVDGARRAARARSDARSAGGDPLGNRGGVLLCAHRAHDPEATLPIAAAAAYLMCALDLSAQRSLSAVALRWRPGAPAASQHVLHGLAAFARTAAAAELRASLAARPAAAAEPATDEDAEEVAAAVRGFVSARRSRGNTS
jgi:hypothetical protein